MQARLLFLLVIALVIPTASSAGFLWQSGDSTRNGIPVVEMPDPFEAPTTLNIGGLSRAGARATLTSNFVVPPPQEPDTSVPEPSPGLLTALGLISLACGRRRAA